MLTYLFMGVLSAIALLIIMARLDIRKFVGYPIIVDVLGSFLFAVLFAGTLTGIMVAMVAALSLSAFIWLTRFFMGYKRFTKRNGWEYYPPRMQTGG